jgi:hypothetical protein
VYKETSDEEEEEMGHIMPTKPSAPLYAVGSYVAAVYDQKWYVALVEAEEPENEPWLHFGKVHGEKRTQ